MLASTRHPQVAQLIKQRVAIARRAQEQQAREHHGAASKLLLAAGDEVVEVHAAHDSVCRTLLQYPYRCVAKESSAAGDPAIGREGLRLLPERGRQEGVP